MTLAAGQISTQVHVAPIPLTASNKTLRIGMAESDNMYQIKIERKDGSILYNSSSIAGADYKDDKVPSSMDPS
jgi:spore coat protein CotH